ncbi:hypothetical protein B9Z55_003313 [Caenorhabditis nigoni]|uniref:PAN-3 domain-containing protein n=1 Tax=Caenorhabditis nigoni TaxID=1611254 RepID=A0A2G5VPN8_9PELO|nr:hypothetical protein B9Z55_003313 [Caenorhabditis nigoni]
MNLIHGTPSEFTTSLKFEVSWDYCISYCYQTSTCLAAYYQDEFPEICEIFEIGKLAKIQKLNAYSGKIMAVKTTSPSECSLSSNDSLMFGTVSTESTWQNYSIQVSPDFWIIDSSPFFECPDNFKLWQRAKGMWCMGAFDITDPFMSSTNSYIWGSGLPDGFENGIWQHDCLVFRVTSQGGAGVDDLPCSWTGNAKKVFLNGFICGVKPEEI